MALDYTVYMAGPISGLSFDECYTWREQTQAFLAHRGIQAINPLRAKSYLRDSRKIEDCYQDSLLSTQKGITSRDHFDCKRADMLLVNVKDAKTVSIGTCMEIAWAKAYNKPVVLLIEDEGNIHDHCMIRECCDFRVNNLDAALEIVQAVLLTHIS